MRDKLIELISEVQYMGGLESRLADHLLANGVIVLPCKLGDVLYSIEEFTDGTPLPEIFELTSDEITVEEDGWFLYDGCSIRHEDFGKTLFTSYEEAELEAALKEARE